MTKNTFTITIDSILGGLAPTSHFFGSGQFKASLGIDPAQPIDDLDSVYSTIASGLIRPVASEKFSGSVINSAPLFIKTNPKNSFIYVYDSLGSAYTIDALLATVTELSDAGHLSSSLGNGCAYYDNYMYFAKNTDICRYGPLNGSPVFDPTYWTITLALTALSNTTYPSTFLNDIRLPNHPMCRHSDGILYVGDVVGNQGYLHCIQTKKTTVEGDTNDGSTYLKLPFGYGLWPTVIESYGTDLAIALFEGSNVGIKQEKAKIAFWDTTSNNFNKITWVEFPDSLITAMKNVNGVLYVVSGNYKTRGFRISRFLGGYSYDEVYYSETGEPCLPGAIDSVLNRCVFGNHTTVPESDGCVYGIGLQKQKLSNKGLFNIMRATGGDSSTNVTAVCFADATEMAFNTPIIGWTKGSGVTNNGLDKQGTTYNNSPSVLWLPLYRIGKSFKITEISIPLSQYVEENMTITPKLYFDSGKENKLLNSINWSNYPNKGQIIIKPAGAVGKNNFWLELRWTGSKLLTVELPIIIKGETFDE